MRNLHEYYYKDYFSLQDIRINNVNRHLDYQLLLDDVKKKQLEGQLGALERQKKEAHKHQNNREEARLETEMAEIKAQLSVNVNVLKVRNSFLTDTCYSKRDQRGVLTRELLEEAYVQNEISPDDNNNRFPLSVQYPGLVTGIGIDHETKIEGEFKLGMHFDWTYGMPVIYGSSVKGVLRSALIAKITKERVFYDDYFLKEVTGRAWSDDEIELLIDDIFEGKKSVKCEDGTFKKINKSIYDRDVFFDAVIMETDSKGRILCSDSITPHGDNPLKNPTPLTFLKIASGCKLQFRFALKPTKSETSTIKVEMSEKDKINLFKRILTTVGVGAKTNVGYGQLEEAPEKETK